MSCCRPRTKDRRTIFEEAAGISRFKAKKIETLRKLERVDQNLQRLQDILEEVEKQLRSVKLQAAKAQRYQEYSARLKELRVGLGLREYHELDEQLQTPRQRLEAAARGAGQRAGPGRRVGSGVPNELEIASADLDDAPPRRTKASWRQARQQIKPTETTLTHEWRSPTDLETELARDAAALAELTRHVGVLAAATAGRIGEELAAKPSTQASAADGKSSERES